MLSSFEQTQFISDKEEYSPRAFYDQFSKQLPRLIKITKGYYGEEQTNTFEVGQVLFIRKSFSQERVMANVLQGPSPLTQKLLSIPLDYNANFSIVSKKRHMNQNLRQILSEQRLPTDVIVVPEIVSDISNSSALTKLIDNKDTLVLRLSHQYKDTFLLAHNLIEDKVTSHIQKLPLFLTNLGVSLVVGRVGYDAIEWNSYLHDLNEICTYQINCDQTIGKPDIAVYDEELDGFDAFIQVPGVYCTIMDCHTVISVDQEVKSSNPSEENCNTSEVSASCSRGNQSSLTQNEKMSPLKLLKKIFVPKTRSSSSFDCSGKGCDAAPDVLTRSCTGGLIEDSGQKLQSRLSGEYEEITFTSRKKVLGKSCFYGKPENGKKKDC